MTSASMRARSHGLLQAVSAKSTVPMHHTMTVAAPVLTVTKRRPAVAVKSDVKTGHDIAYVTHGHASGCAGAMAYYTRTGDPPGRWEGRGCAALGVSGTVQAEVAERLTSRARPGRGADMTRPGAGSTSRRCRRGPSAHRKLVRHSGQLRPDHRK